MPILQPPGFPTGNLATQDQYLISRYLNSPTFILRDLRTIADQIFVGNRILTGQFYTRDGAAIYEQIESIFASNLAQAVAPGDEYPLSPIPTGPAQIAEVLKWGLDTILTDESVSRQNFNVVETAFIKLVNSLYQQIDALIMSAVVNAVSLTVNAGASTVTGATPSGGANWNGSGTNAARIVRDVMFADELMRSEKQGYNGDIVLTDLQTFAAVMGDPSIAALIPREDFGRGVSNMPVMKGNKTGLQQSLLGKTWLSTPNLPNGAFSPFAAVLDSSMLGAMLDEELPAPGYVGSQDDGAAGGDGRSMIQVKTMREDKQDRWRVRCRRNTVPMIIEPKAVVQIVGV